ncbi:class II fructose-bisphosphate aldolase family protein [Patescibacteria group bacterium]|nr:class II fructose-bisphosphate aldolase family protein [Patescibacteria group bacterium]
MKTLRECLKEAAAARRAVGHFNISNLEGLWSVFNAARERGVPVIIGVSEGERAFVGVRQVAALVSSLRDEYQYPIFLNADHTYSFDKVKEAIDAGFDAVIFDGTELPFEENVRVTRQCVEYARKVRPEIIVEGELGFIGKSSKVLSGIPDGVKISEEFLTKSEEAVKFVRETAVDLLAPAVGNIHGMLSGGRDPALNTGRVAEIARAANIPLVLHGASGNSAEDIKKAIIGGVVIVHVNTELRVAYRQALAISLQNHPDEVAPYKYLKDALLAMQKVVAEKIAIFNGISS